MLQMAQMPKPSLPDPGRRRWKDVNSIIHTHASLLVTFISGSQSRLLRFVYVAIN